MLEQVIELLPNGGKAASARVSAKWSDIAIASLWKDLDNVLPLLQLISPLTGGDHSGYTVVRLLSNARGSAQQLNGSV